MKKFLAEILCTCHNNFAMLTPEEIKSKTLEIARRKGFIDSIFNYCDRWCERCAFTTKCRNYEFEMESPPPDGPELWEYLHNVFKATFMMVEEQMKEMGIDPADIEDVPEDPDKDPEKHPLAILARETAFHTHEWLETHDICKKIGDQADLDIQSTAESSRYKDSVEVIYHYNFFISAKISRAISGLLEHDEFSDYDMNGSAKIALVSIDRLIAAWMVVMKELHEYEDDILKILVKLAEIRKIAENTFPEGREFVRPGFDEHG